MRLAQKTKTYFFLALFLLPFFLYWNALDNEYAIDDNLVVDGVAIVEGGISSIPEIFTSFYSTDKLQSFGYRPVVSTSFAVEKEFFGGLLPKQSEAEKRIDNKITQANISHFINVLLYAFSGLLLFYFLSLILPHKNFFLPFLICLLFLLLPIHTEVVNNIKSRDVLLLFIGMLGSLIFYVKYARKANLLYLLPAMFCVLFALYSKKSGIALLGVVPVVLYFIKADFKKIGIAFFSTLISVVAAFFIKKMLLPAPGVRNLKFFENPLFVEGGFFDRLATGFYTAFFYLKMMLFPSEFSFYYGYAKIPKIDWSFFQVWLGVLIFVPLAVYGMKRFLKRDILGLGIVLWLGVMLGVVNVAFPIVGVVAERFAFVFSMGFCIVLGVLLFRLFNLKIDIETKKIQLPKFFLGVMAVVVLTYSIKVMARNDDWENYLTLYRSDIGHLQKSAKANVMLANRLYPKIKFQNEGYEKQKLIRETIGYYENALAVAPGYSAAINNLAYLYIKHTGNYQDAISLLKKVEKKGRVETIYNLAFAYSATGQNQKAIPYLLKAIANDPQNKLWYEKLFEIAQQPTYRDVIEKKLTKISPELEGFSSQFCIQMGNYYFKKGEKTKALYYYEKALKLVPSNDELYFFTENLRNSINKN